MKKREVLPLCCFFEIWRAVILIQSSASIIEEVVREWQLTLVDEVLLLPSAPFFIKGEGKKSHSSMG